MKYDLGDCLGSLGTQSYRYPTEEEIIKKTADANKSDLDFSKAKGKYMGYHESLGLTTAELFRPITDATKMKAGSETSDIVKQNIQNDPNLSISQKLTAMNAIDKVKLEKFTPKDVPKKTPEEQRKEEVNQLLRMQNDPILGIIRFDRTRENFFVFGITALFKNADIGKIKNIYDLHQIAIDCEAGKIRMGKPSSSDNVLEREFMYSNDLMILLTMNTTDGPGNAKDVYMDIIDFCIGYELKNFKSKLEAIQRSSTQEYKQKIEHENDKLDLLQRLRENVKFVNWISPKYGIPLRIQADRVTKSGVRYTPSADTSFASADDDDDVDEWNPKTGKGIRFVAISPHSDERIKRAAVLLGYKRSAKDDNPDALEEFSGILDSLLKEGKLHIKGYKKFMRLWFSKNN